MAKFNEQTLDGWRKPASQSEEQKISNAIRMIKDAVRAHDRLKDKNIEFVVQGSYGNDTNVKLDSDIDVCIMLKDTFYSEYRKGASREDYGFTMGTNDFDNYRKWVIEALQIKFGAENVTPGNKSIKIDSNNYRVQADAVPAFQYRNYRYETKNDPDDFVEGIKFFALDGSAVINYPKVHIQNGKNKNAKTQRRYKRAVRLYKRIRNRMIDDGLPVSKNIRSFLIEGLLWNVPDSEFNKSTTWNDLLKNTIISLYNNTKEEETCKDWGEVSEYFYLFHSSRKWNRADTNAFLVQMWNYLGYGS